MGQIREKSVITALTALIIIAPTYSSAAEAFSASISHFAWPILTVPKTRIAAPKPDMAQAQSALLNLSLFAQITTAPPAQDEVKTPLAPEPERRAEIFAADFIKADRYHLIPNLNDGTYGEADFILDRQTLDQFATLPDSAERLSQQHLTQRLLDEAFVIWPAIPNYDPMTGAQLIYEVPSIIIQTPITAKITFTTAPDLFLDFTGMIRLSFIDDEALMTMASGAHQLSLHFNIQNWRNAAIMRSDGNLYHNQKQYQAAVTLAHSRLPDPAMMGSFKVLNPDDDSPLHGQFRNFNLPDK